MINEDMSNKLVNLEIRVGKASAKEIINVIGKLFEYCKENGQSLKDFLNEKVKSNSRPLKDLVKKGQLSSIDVNESKLRYIKRELNKYGVNFSIMKDKDSNLCSLFFQSKNTAIIEMAFKNILKKSEEKNKESIILTLKKFKDKVKERDVIDKLKNKRRERSL